MQFYQRRSHAIVLHDTLSAVCIEKAVCIKTKEELNHKVVLKANSHSGQQDQQEQDARTSCDQPSGSQSSGETHPITAKDQSRIHQFRKKVLPGLFLGYALYAGGIWKGDVLIADLEELETMDASEIYSKRLNAKEVIFPKEKENLFFQSQMDESKPLEEIRT